MTYLRLGFRNVSYFLLSGALHVLQEHALPAYVARHRKLDFVALAKGK
jgi:hypothetical protein